MDKKALADSFMAMMKEATKDMPPPISSLRGKDLFLRYIDLHQAVRNRERTMDAADLDVGNFVNDYYGMAKCMMHLAFAPHQVESIEWWLYEDVEKVIYWPEEDREWRLDTPEHLWDYLQSTHATDGSV